MTNHQTAPLSIKNLTVRYHGQDQNALSNINLDFESGKMTAIVGPNGAGKSTLLKAALDLIDSENDSLTFFEQTLKDARKKIAYVPQRASVDWDFPIRVQEVVQQGLSNELKLTDFFTPKSHKALALQALEKVGLQDFATRQISKLSGGQQQRMFLARALVQGMSDNGAELYLLDEPFAGVDAATEKIIIDILKELAANGNTVIAVHHNLATVPEYFDNVALINGSLITHGAVSDVFTDENVARTYIPVSNTPRPNIATP